MKKVIILIGLFLASMVIPVNLIAREIYMAAGPALQRRIYKVPVVTADSKKIIRNITNRYDSVLILFPPALPFDSVKMDDRLPRYRYVQSEEAAIKRKGAALRGAWQGALIGLAAGFIAGDDPAIPAYNNPNDPIGNALTIYANALRFTATEKAFTLGIMGACAGGSIGALLASLLKKKHITGRKKQKFRLMRQNIPENFIC